MVAKWLSCFKKKKNSAKFERRPIAKRNHGATQASMTCLRLSIEEIWTRGCASQATAAGLFDRDLAFFPAKVKIRRNHVHVHSYGYGASDVRCWLWHIVRSCMHVRCTQRLLYMFRQCSALTAEIL